MFEYFTNLNYWKTKNKLRTIRELLNSIDGISIIERTLPEINDALNHIDTSIEVLTLTLPPKLVIFRNEEEEEEEEVLPDLIVSSIEPTLHDNYVDYAITVKNIGEEVAAQNSLNVVLQGISNVNLSVPILAINGSVTLYHQYSFNPDSEEEENKTVIATADANNSVIESNERNNTKSIQSEVKGQYAPPPGKGNLIVHIHNPEGKEIGSIVGAGDISLNYGVIPIDEATHGIPTEVDLGTYDVVATFNGITLNEEVTLVNDEEGVGETLEIFFIFERTEHELDYNCSKSLYYENTMEIEFFKTYYDSNVNSDDCWDVLRNLSITVAQWAGSFTYKHTASYNVNPLLYNHFVKFEYTHIKAGNFNIGTNITSQLPEGVHIKSMSPIQSYTNFSSWYVQKNITGDYPKIQIFTEDELTGTTIVDWDLADLKAYEGYSLDKISSDYIYTKFRPQINTQFNRVSQTSIFGPDSGGSEEKSGAGTCDIKMSSIPYDMEGTAV